VKGTSVRTFPFLYKKYVDMALVLVGFETQGCVGADGPVGFGTV